MKPFLAGGFPRCKSGDLSSAQRFRILQKPSGHHFSEELMSKNFPQRLLGQAFEKSPGPSLGFSRQEHWSGLPFPSPMHGGGGRGGTKAQPAGGSRGGTGGGGARLRDLSSLKVVTSRGGAWELPSDPVGGSSVSGEKTMSQSLRSFLACGTRGSPGPRLRFWASSWKDVIVRWGTGSSLTSLLHPPSIFPASVFEPVTPWTTAYQAPPSMGFSRQEYWSGLPWPSPDMPLNYCEEVI